MSTLDHLRLLLETPTVPIYLLRSDNNEIFEMDENSQFLAPRLKETFKRYMICNTRTGTIICLKPINPPEFETSIAVNGSFSHFLRSNTEAASKLVEIFLCECCLEDLISLVAYFRDRINPELFYYALNIALTNRADTCGIIGDISSSFPSKFFSGDLIGSATSDIGLNINSSSADPVKQDSVACSHDPENRMSYFREDLGINSHHWHWHLVYLGNLNDNRRGIVAKDRRGELFFYMHQQFLARYDADRICNNLEAVKPYYSFREVNKEGYYSKLKLSNSSKDIPGRPDNMIWRDIIRPADNMIMLISDLENYYDRIKSTIDMGCLMPQDHNGENHLHAYTPLTLEDLGNLMEPSDLSRNRNFYGSMHLYGHIFTGFIHDPENKHGQPMGVMGDVATAVRDPLFYKWHKTVDNLFDRFKSNEAINKKYTASEIIVPNVVVTGVEITTKPNTYRRSVKKNQLITHMQNTVVRVKGLDFQKNQPTYIPMNHLNHVPFTYKINISNAGSLRYGTIRIFMAPKFNDCGDEYNLNHQRRFFIEMDRFVVSLSTGNNEFHRESTSSVITIPFRQVFPDVTAGAYSKEGKDSDYCSCGWPEHMLVPKGSKEGTVFQLFVMVSDYESDKVPGVSTPNSVTCKEASSYCGLKDQKYPDNRNMGYPFDKPFDNEKYKKINDFVTKLAPGVCNMQVQDVTIKFVETTSASER